MQAEFLNARVKPIIQKQKGDPHAMRSPSLCCSGLRNRYATPRALAGQAGLPGQGLPGQGCVLVIVPRLDGLAHKRLRLCRPFHFFISI
jgi:hypothetical protein